MRAVYQKGLGEEEGIKFLTDGGIQMPSFTDPDVSYEVYPASGECNCDRYRYTEYCKKHVALGEALLKVREMPSGRVAAFESVVELARKLYAPFVHLDPGLSYQLFLEAKRCPYATETMIADAWLRHRRVLTLAEYRGAA